VVLEPPLGVSVAALPQLNMLTNPEAPCPERVLL
jgi:hypothetical protein